jgi:ubiquinone/menaquinone biosynthesis C-methylase UbiE
MRVIDEHATAATRARYARIAPFYDLMEVLPEARYRIWRERFWAEVNRRLPSGARLLEVGIDTGKNMPY